MLTLRELQKAFVDALNNKSKDLENFINQSHNLLPEQHLEIYQNSVIGNLQIALQEIYPVCSKLVGPDFFLHLSNEYINRNHSYDYNLSNYGHDFGDFVRHFPNLQNLPYLEDVALLEWAWHKAFNAEDVPGINWKEFEAIYQSHSEKIVFILPPESSLLQSPYPIHLIWEANQENSNNEEQIILPKNKFFYYFVWRNNLSINIDNLSLQEWYLLSLLKQEFSIKQIYEKLLKEQQNLAIDLILVKCVEHGYLMDFKVI